MKERINILTEFKNLFLHIHWANFNRTKLKTSLDEVNEIAKIYEAFKNLL